MTRPWVLVAFHFTCHPGRTKLQQAGLAAEAVPSSMAAKVCFENNNKKKTLHSAFCSCIIFALILRKFINKLLLICHNDITRRKAAQMYYNLFSFISHQALLLLLLLFLQPLLIGMKSAIAQAIAQATYFLLAA